MITALFVVILMTILVAPRNRIIYAKDSYLTELALLKT